jgi:hypothetical protein
VARLAWPVKIAMIHNDRNRETPPVSGAAPGMKSGKLEAVEGLVAREVERLGGIMEEARDTSQNPHWRREFENLLRGCEYTYRGGQLVILAPHPARAARVRLDSDAIAAAWQRLNEGEARPSIVVRVLPGHRQ